MKKVNNFKFIIMIILFSSLVQSCVEKYKDEPVRSKEISIQNHEFIKYTKYIGGEKTHTVFVVFETDRANHIVRAYINISKVGKEAELPQNYSNYSIKMVVSLDKGSLLEEDLDYTSVKESDFVLKTPDKSFLKIDLESYSAYYRVLFNKEGQEKSLLSKFKLKKEYPVWSISSLMMIGCRFMDASRGGILYIVEPNYVKDPVPAYFRVVGKEVLETKAGKFNTIKVGFSTSDPFLGSLLNSYTSEIFFWVEDSARALVVKTQIENNVNLIEEISTWRNKRR